MNDKNNIAQHHHTNNNPSFNNPTPKSTLTGTDLITNNSSVQGKTQWYFYGIVKGKKIMKLTGRGVINQ